MFSIRTCIRAAGVLAFLLFALTTQPTLFAQSANERFYYYQGAQVPLTVNPRLVAVRFDANTTPDVQRQILGANGNFESLDAGVASPVGGLVFVPVRAGSNPAFAAEQLGRTSGVEFASPVYDFGTVQLAETEQFLVRFKPELSDAQIAEFNRQQGAVIVGAQPYGDRVVILQPAADNPRRARELANQYFEAGVAEFAEPNFVIRATLPNSPLPEPAEGEAEALTPSDADFRLQWALKNTRQFQGAQAGADINAPGAWNITQGASNLVIAVIDEGIDGSHPELAGKLLTGYNALNGSSDTTPKRNDHHGTGVAGIAAANSNNGAGVAGVCWSCKILPVKVAETDAAGNWVTTTGALAAGIDWAWQNGADVLNNSWTMNAFSDTVQTAIVNARFGGRGGKGSTIVFAAGNANASSVAFPASLNSYVIAVGASNWCDQRKTPTSDACNNSDGSWGSNYGSALDLLAPGEAIYAPCNGTACTNGRYTYLSGTSAATPLVSGAAALLYALNPNLTPDKIQKALQDSAKDIGAAGKDNETGYGRLNVQRALASLYNLEMNATADKTFVQPGAILNYTLSYGNNGATAMGATTLQAALPANTTYVSSTPAFTANGANYLLNLGTLAPGATGTATFRVRASASAAGQPIVLNASIGGAFPETVTADNAATVTSFGIKRLLYLPFLQLDAGD